MVSVFLSVLTGTKSPQDESVSRCFLFSRCSLKGFWCVLVCHLWITRARHFALRRQGIAADVLKVGDWLTQGDFALEVVHGPG